MSELVETLLARMTLDEKIGQLTLMADVIRPFGVDANPDPSAQTPDELRAMVRAGAVGALFNGAGAAAARETQRIAVEESRLGVPLLFGADVIHGMRTVFPIPLAESASWEPALAERTARAAAVEATREGLHWTFAPMVDVARDQRWGRVAESAGEDTFLACAFAAARVRGFQGSDLRAEDSMLATPKHFAAYGAVAAGLDYAAVDISPQTLRDVHLPPFKAALDAGALSIMSAFNDLNGVPCTANRELLTGVLREEWGFQGLVVSDYTSDLEMVAHGYAADAEHAAALSLNAGLDMSMQSQVYARHLRNCVAKGRVEPATLDAAVRRVLSVKAALGLFDNPYRSLDPDLCADRSHLPAHEALAREAARRSIVMLRNEGGVLPLRADQRIALIGPFAADAKQLGGCWNLFGDASRMVDLAQALRQALAPGQGLHSAPGCSYEHALPGGIEAALRAAAEAEVIVLTLGEPLQFTGEAQSRTQIDLPAPQFALAEALLGTGKPVVLLLSCGRALALPPLLQRCAAILVQWSLGSQGGPALADVLLGAYNPSARLPVSFAHDSGQQPYYYNHTRSGRPYAAGGPEIYRTRWRETPNEALYPFGHGLGYAPMVYGPVRLGSARLEWDGELSATVRVHNQGSCAGEEVVQLYVHDRVASRVRPVRELKGFQKISLAAGESRDVTFVLRRTDLLFHGTENQPTVEAGHFDLWIAPSATAGEAAAFELLAPRPAR